VARTSYSFRARGVSVGGAGNQLRIMNYELTTPATAPGSVRPLLLALWPLFALRSQPYGGAKEGASGCKFCPRTVRSPPESAKLRPAPAGLRMTGPAGGLLMHSRTEPSGASTSNLNVQTWPHVAQAPPPAAVQTRTAGGGCPTKKRRTRKVNLEAPGVTLERAGVMSDAAAFNLRKACASQKAWPTVPT